MKKIVFLCLALVLVAALIFVGCAQPAPAPAPAPKPAPAPTPAPSPAPAPSPKPAPAEKINLRFAAMWPEPSPNYQMVLKPILDEIEQKSNGRITFTLFLGGTLGGGAEQYDIIRTGKVDIGNFTSGYSPGRFPLTDILTLPAAYENTEAGQKAALAIYDRMLAKEYNDTQPLAVCQTVVSYLYTANKQVKTMGDMKGMKVRSPGGIITPALEALSATPVFLPLPDTYLSLQTGVIEGAVFGPGAGPGFKLQEVLKHELKFKLGYQTDNWAMSLDSWAKIPADLKPVLTTAARKGGFYMNDLLTKYGPIFTDMLVKRPGTSATLDAAEEARWVNAMKPVINKWVTDLEAKGLPGKQLMDAAREECKKYNTPFPW